MTELRRRVDVVLGWLGDVVTEHEKEVARLRGEIARLRERKSSLDQEIQLRKRILQQYTPSPTLTPELAHTLLLQRAIAFIRTQPRNMQTVAVAENYMRDFINSMITSLQPPESKRGTPTTTATATPTAEKLAHVRIWQQVSQSDAIHRLAEAAVDHVTKRRG